MDLLVLFVQRQGQLVTRDDIVERLWSKDILIDVDRSINAAVRKIRGIICADLRITYFVAFPMTCLFVSAK